MRHYLFMPTFFIASILFCQSESLVFDPPYSGTIFIDPDIITEEDISTFIEAPYTGQGVRTMYDRRVNDWITVTAYLFDATFNDGLTSEIQVNPEFGSSDSAFIEAEKYGIEIGRLPTVLRDDVETVWIHRGTNPFGGGNNNILIHIGQALNYINDGILEETLVHEAAHTSLDANHAASSGWLTAQTIDGEFISTYAQDYPDREDIAESFLPYLAIRYRADRIDQSTFEIITQTIPNRIQYFDDQLFNLYPITTLANEDGPSKISYSIHQNYPNPFNPITKLHYSISKNSLVSIVIYDILGNQVKTLINQTQDAGYRSVIWDATNDYGKPVSAGIYLYQIQAGEYISTKKMVLLK